ncbi:uncharacterized protein LOC143459166 isoform X2 [Clavelina lepadiformis]|uniref:uncharacterized protein LOC143459166 isoform X2 n=1 Tax=Clavelina lepadiformis TaxID=159417 RepID=UPI0040419CD5
MTGIENCKVRQRFDAFVFLLIVCILVDVNHSFAQGVNFCQHNDTTLQLINNGYETLIVWIGQAVKEDFQLVRQIQELIQKLSLKLFALTKRRAYIGKVQIIIPSTWGTSPDWFPGNIANSGNLAEFQSQAQIWIRNSSPRSGIKKTLWSFGDPFAYIAQPYVIKTTPCGFPGSYLRISPEFIRFGEAVQEHFGPQDKILAREWAKLRWGLYDETAVHAEASRFYLHSDLSIRPTICSSTIPGKNANISSQTDSCDLEKIFQDATCRFKPSKGSLNQTYASLLYRTDLQYVDEFCDDHESVSNNFAHDNEAPTKHNLHCRGRSAWSVIRNHPDFADGNNPPMLDSQPPTTTFTIVQDLDRRVVLVLDVSSSMSLNGRLELMQQAVSHYIDTVSLNTWVGIVCFGWYAQIKSNLMEVKNDDVRHLLKSRLMFPTVKGTSIGSGILKALDVLSQSGPKRLRGFGGNIIILTDGLEHNQPKINDTLSDVKASGVTVNTIAFGSVVSKDLEILARISKGKIHAASSGEFAITGELQEAFLSHQENENDGAIPLLSEEQSIPKNSTIAQEFLIDDSVGKNTKVSVFYDGLLPPLISLESPSGKLFVEDKQTKDFSFTQNEKFKTINIAIVADAEVGRWKLVLTNPSLSKRSKVRVSVISFQKDEEPLVVSPALLCRRITFSGSEAVVIYAYLSKGELAVLSAQVVAEVTRPLALSGIVDRTFVKLLDEGLDPDITADDGVYSAYFTAFTLTGRYNVKVFVTDNNGKAFITTDNVLGIGRVQSPIIAHDTRQLLKNSSSSSFMRARKRRSTNFLPAFERVSSAAGAFIVEEWNAENLCGDGYHPFQDSCYKFYNTLQLSAGASRAVCENDGGYLTAINSRQELAWLSLRIMVPNEPASENVWFGGIDKSLKEYETLDIKKISFRQRRDMEDFDLTTLARIFTNTNNSEDMVSALFSFDPDISHLPTSEIRRLVQSLGMESMSELSELPLTVSKMADQNLNARNKRQITAFSNEDLLSFQVAPALSSEITASYKFHTGLDTTVVTFANYGNTTGISDVTLYPAKSEPKVPDPLSSGADIPTCFWLQNGNIIESTGDVCQSFKKFVCEKSQKDRLPPSRIVDLDGTFDRKSKTLTLTWSAPGDDLNLGTATDYEIRTLSSRRAVQTLTANFESGHRIEKHNIFNKSENSPQMAGKKELVMINLEENLACPSHAVLDIILALSPMVTSSAREDQATRRFLLEFIENIISNFNIGVNEIQIAALTLSPRNEQIFGFNESLNKIEILKRLERFTPKQSKNRSVPDAITSIKSSGGRDDAPKVLLVITDTPVKFFDGLRQILTVLMVSFSNPLEKLLLWNITSPPVCKNSFVVEDINNILSISDDIVHRVCQARDSEFQAVGVIAVDDAGLKGEPSNFIRFQVENTPEVEICANIEPLSNPALIAAGNTATIIGVSVGIPLTLILLAVGSVMLFGQIKKYRKNHREKNEKLKQDQKKEEIQTAQQAALARNKDASTSVRKPSDLSKKNSNNNCLKKFKLFCKNDVEPIHSMPV